MYRWRQNLCIIFILNILYQIATSRMLYLEREVTPYVEKISSSPRAYILHNFLSAEECKHLKKLGNPNLTKSLVVDSQTGQRVEDNARTSSGTFINRRQDSVVERIEERISKMTFLPVKFGEPMQILRYKEGEQYRAHMDYFADQYNIQNGGQRVATVLMYLSDVEEGGETIFPSVEGYDPEHPDCSKRGLAVKPKMGDALLFYSMSTDGITDARSKHAACPVIKGTKWSATKWIRQSVYKG